ncbi:MAG: type II secretion system protein GspD [Candidatus Dactylopiibacterium carminicum]|uniref:Type II secretion system protein GspD n=1 Tax=Candidatus Dactylopiibacterium carminicum TaxID=857335 RepID=A0A272ER21_9RHOO|nr:type II secretion system secretin GspD [Candidatus Dactylopiibacterium carminicum]KAF7598708.1 type II secretion system protein GspD [Candidatus Dactylopiibacterium carminicum]PAS92526.1 MAG: type II secretion system protein GspD [Candidatus Dactylopiibacterium carminicum]PAS98575.1 MAG: type II secretion system protein GspD [Candidatus Dactylopiibacterium carminicum]
MKVKALTATVLLCFTLNLQAQDASDQVTLNFVNSELEATLKAVTLITGKSFVIDPKLKGTVNIVSNQPVSRTLVLPIVQSALRSQGIALVDTGTVVKVVAEAEAKQHGSPVVAGDKVTATGDKYITQVYPLRHESANRLAQVLRPLVGPNSVIAAYQAGNTLVINDYAENLARINRIIEHIDQPPSVEVFSIPVKNGAVLDISQNLARLMPEVLVQGVAAPVAVPEGVRRSLVINDTRNSQLLIRAETRVHAERIRQIVELLDQPSVSPGNINVVYLRNAEAARLAATLRGILTGQDSGNTTNSGASGSGSGSTAASSAVTTSTTSGSTSTNVKIDGITVMIQADSVTNSLIVTAPDYIYNNIRTVIDKLDVRRAQVHIEAMIVELNVSKGGEFGFQWAVAGGLISSLSTTTTNSIATIATALASSSTSATIPEGFNVGIFNGDPTKGTASLGALASALQSTGDANVLSTPSIQTLDNEEARIVVGQNIPIITGSTLSSTNFNPYTTVERKDIGMKLKIRPQISEGGAITMTVAQEVSSIDSTVNTDGTGIATKLRTIETQVLVDDGQIVVLGGLIEDQVSNNEKRVPLLADIPWLGQLFRYRDRSHSKVNLMVFLKPTILRDSKANAALASERYEYIRQLQVGYNPEHSVVLPDLPTVSLPELPSAQKGAATTAAPQAADESPKAP